MTLQHRRQLPDLTFSMCPNTTIILCSKRVVDRSTSSTSSSSIEQLEHRAAPSSGRGLLGSEMVADRPHENRRIREPRRVALSVWRLRSRVGDMSSRVQASDRRVRECRDDPGSPTFPTSRPPSRVATRRLVANCDRSTVALAMAYRCPSRREHEGRETAQVGPITRTSIATSAGMAAPLAAVGNGRRTVRPGRRDPRATVRHDTRR